MATVDILNNGTSRNSEAMHLVRCMAFILAKMQLSVLVEHIPGVHSMLADTLSTNNLSSLFPYNSIRDGQLFNYRDNRDYFIGNNRHRELFLDNQNRQLSCDNHDDYR